MLCYLKYAAVGFAAATLVSGQTYSECNPMKKTCPANVGTTESRHTFDFTKSSGLDQWTTTAGTVKTGPNGAEFTVSKQGDAPTIRTDFHIFFGEVSVTMKSAPGTGIVSSIVLQSDDLDEIDWEAVGGDKTQIQTNYFGKGDTTTYDRATWESVSTPQEVFHTYKVVWTKEATTWSVDDKVIRTLSSDDAQSGTRYPQTPHEQGTIQWAGGLTDYSKVPYTMYIKDVTIVNYNPAESYTWSDQSGSAESIKFTGSTNSTSSTASKPSVVGSLITAASTARPSSSGSVSGPSVPSSSPVFNAASNLSAGSLGFLSVLAVVSGFLLL
ncbi:Concanavalin A-like lectin/glucanases superfamily [Penicillium coprophilum]|uniref:Concanavalin A-like lectin/glucanases superfamily n=1 Tax=Penicillium coprophilum TaxID=36646 RepID=UPI00238404CB|nr:Concanavalin A-like lectin/glucanases superfamily [Penicillium coprophilum]KAJ5173808.1 Concanavalin A-like lectin/glucanases superfamily [Penicillium coprophilum]